MNLLFNLMLNKSRKRKCLYAETKHVFNVISFETLIKKLKKKQLKYKACKKQLQ